MWLAFLACPLAAGARTFWLAFLACPRLGSDLCGSILSLSSSCGGSADLGEGGLEPFRLAASCGPPRAAAGGGRPLRRIDRQPLGGGERKRRARAKRGFERSENGENIKVRAKREHASRRLEHKFGGSSEARTCELFERASSSSRRRANIQVRAKGENIKVRVEDEPTCEPRSGASI